LACQFWGYPPLFKISEVFIMSKPKLVYYTSAPEDGDSVAAFLRTDGGALTSTTIDAVEALDVNVANAIEVAMDGIYDDPDNLLPDSAGAIFHVRGATVDITSQTLRVTGAAPANAVDPANVIALDVNSFLMGFDTDHWDRLTSTSGALDINIASTEIAMEVGGNVADDAADSGNPVKVGSRALGAALSAVSAANDRADMVSDLYRRILVNDAPNVASKQVLVATNSSTAVQLDATVQAGRMHVLIQNMGDKAIFVGNASVTASGSTQGIKIPAKGEIGPIPWGQYVPVYAIAESGTPSAMLFQIG
jgi:hypothetical protein